MLNYIINLLKSFNSNSKPSQIANSFCIGLILGFMPKNNLFWYILLVFFTFVRINKPGYFIMMIIGSVFASYLDPIFDFIGYTILSFEPLKSFYITLLDIPFVGFTKFNNTIVCGSFALGLVCYLPLFFIMIGFINLWRKFISPKFNNSK